MIVYLIIPARAQYYIIETYRTINAAAHAITPGV